MCSGPGSVWVCEPLLTSVSSQGRTIKGAGAAACGRVHPALPSRAVVSGGGGAL